MNSEDIYEGVTGIRDDLIQGAAGPSRKKKHKMFRPRWIGAIAAVLAVALVGNLALRSAGGGGSSSPGSLFGDLFPTAQACEIIAQAQYPELAPYPDESDYIKPNGEYDDAFQEAFDAWWEDAWARRHLDLGDTTALRAFFARSTQTFLTGEPGENLAYSPLNVYMALSMLAELTGGESREQILSLLGSESVEALRRQVGDLWTATYRNDGAVTTVMANSLWLNKDVSFVRETLDTLAQSYYASSYRGEMGSEGLNKALRDWLNEQTGGLLKDYADGVELDARTVLALASTLYFRAKWSSEFMPSRTEKDIFHSPNGDMECDFMRQGDSDTYYWGERFSAISKHFTEGGRMWFLLPDEGVSPEELLEDGEAMEFLFSVENYYDDWANQKYLIVNKSIPKFDVSSKTDLLEGLRTLGVTDVLDPLLSDFSPMTTDLSEPIILSQADHAVRVVIDEEGCTAAAFTVMANAGAGMPPTDEIDFVLDRPFLFCVTSERGLPLFVGIVNQVSEK